MGFGLWTMIGLLVDAYFHSTDPGLESFWTPWHALFYSGFTATAAWLVWLSMKRSQPEGNVLTWAPPGYRAALFGVGIFAVGGVGDAIWHSVFGVETSLDALLSPTHLLLFVGLILIMSAPARATWFAEETTTPTLSEFVPTLASLAMTTTLVAFFFQYVWAPVVTWTMRVPYDPNSGDSETYAALGVVGVILSTLIMFTPLLAASRRWQLPFWTATIVLTFLNVAMAIGFDDDTVAIPAMVLAGITFDVLHHMRVDRRLVAAAPAAVMWIGYFAIIGQTDPGLGLAPEIWGGAIVFAVFATLSVEMVMRLAERTPTATTDDRRPAAC